MFWILLYELEVYIYVSCRKIDIIAEKTQVSSSLILLLIYRSICAPLEKIFSVLRIHVFMIVTQLISLSFVEF